MSKGLDDTLRAILHILGSQLQAYRIVVVQPAQAARQMPSGPVAPAPVAIVNTAGARACVRHAALLGCLVHPSQQTCGTLVLLFDFAAALHAPDATWPYSSAGKPFPGPPARPPTQLTPPASRQRTAVVDISNAHVKPGCLHCSTHPAAACCCTTAHQPSAPSQ